MRFTTSVSTWHLSILGKMRQNLSEFMCNPHLAVRLLVAVRARMRWHGLVVMEGAYSGSIPQQSRKGAQLGICVFLKRCTWLLALCSVAIAFPCSCWGTKQVEEVSELVVESLMVVGHVDGGADVEIVPTLQATLARRSWQIGSASPAHSRLSRAPSSRGARPWPRSRPQGDQETPALQILLLPPAPRGALSSWALEEGTPWGRASSAGGTNRTTWQHSPATSASLCATASSRCGRLVSGPDAWCLGLMCSQGSVLDGKQAAWCIVLSSQFYVSVQGCSCIYLA